MTLAVGVWDKRPGFSLHLRKIFRDPQRSRLHAEIEELEAELEALQRYSDMPKTIMELAENYLERAKEAYGRDVEEGWQQAFHVREQLVRCLHDDRLRRVADNLHAELTEAGRLEPWRRVAVQRHLRMLEQVDGQLGGQGRGALTEGQRDAIIEALRLRNQGLANSYWRLAMVRRHQSLLMLIGFPVLVVSLVILANSASGLTADGWQGGAVLWVLSVLLGILGAITSAAQRSTTIPSQRIPEQLGSQLATWSRLPIGAVAGLTVWLFSIATVQEPADLNVANLLLAAFGAGFAERLIVQGSGSHVIQPGREAGPNGLARSGRDRGE
ncbi:MAG TPA: hypothetical protein VFR23_17280 [Jiangellaceae bacterium]|nr:hypothetical protein [Jiangellaceae bacterium]